MTRCSDAQKESSNVFLWIVHRIVFSPHWTDYRGLCILRQTDRQTDRQTLMDRHRHIHTLAYKPSSHIKLQTQPDTVIYVYLSYYHTCILINWDRCQSSTGLCVLCVYVIFIVIKGIFLSGPLGTILNVCVMCMCVCVCVCWLFYYYCSYYMMIYSDSYVYDAFWPLISGTVCLF